jgi:hypothetical protein
MYGREVLGGPRSRENGMSHPTRTAGKQHHTKEQNPNFAENRTAGAFCATDGVDA